MDGSNFSLIHLFYRMAKAHCSRSIITYCSFDTFPCSDNPICTYSLRFLLWACKLKCAYNTSRHFIKNILTLSLRPESVPTKPTRLIRSLLLISFVTATFPKLKLLERKFGNFAIYPYSAFRSSLKSATSSCKIFASWLKFFPNTSLFSPTF